MPYCPTCAADIESQERSIDGNSLCSNGHKIPNQEVVEMITPALAKMRSDRALRTTCIEGHLKSIDSAIAEATNEGRASIILHFAWGNEYPSPEQQKAIREELVKQGWELKHYNDPDPGSPISFSDYYTIEW